MKTDNELQQDVIEEIKWDPFTRDEASQIGIAAKEGVVTLSGNVSSYSKKLATERAAQRVAGVRVVAVDINVTLSRIGQRGDTVIAEAINNALKWNSAVEEDLIETKVDDGWVYLDGKVRWEYQKKAAERAIRDLIGIRGISNNIEVKSDEVEAKEIKRNISAAFHRMATVDSLGIKVDVIGNRVVLSGKVRSWAERKQAENVVWFSPGVMIIDNQVEVDPALEVV